MPHRLGNSHAILDHIMLPTTCRDDIPALTPGTKGWYSV